MSLQSKVFTLVFGILLGLVFLFYLTASRLIMDQAYDFERFTSMKEIDRMKDLLQQEVDSVDTICADWAYWNDTYEFVDDLNEAYRTENLNVFSLENIDVDYLAYINRRGKLVYYIGLDPETHEEQECPDSLMGWLMKDGSLTKHDQSDSASSGYILVEDQLSAVASRPILNSEGKGEPNGVLVVGKILDQEEQDYLAQISKTEFDFTFIETNPRKKIDSDIQIDLSDEEKLTISTALYDPEEEPVASLQIRLPRTFYQHGLEEKKRLLISILLIGLLMLLATLSTLRILVLRRIKSLTEELDVIADSDQRSLRVSCSSPDEIGRLGRHLNSLLDGIELSQNKLNTANIELEKALKAKRDFLSTITHELRTPLNAIIGTSSVLQQSSETGRELGEYAQIIGRSSETLMGLINNVLDYTKLEAGKLDIEDLPLNLLETIESVVEIVSAQKKASRIEVFCDIDPETPRLIRGDALRLKQIFLNILGNAIKFTHSGYVCFQVRISSDRKSIHFTIIDTGIGIEPEKINLLFNTFTQLDTSTTRKYGGTGLGLSISQRLAQAMGGEIKVQSERGKGSQFKVTLPLKYDEDQRSISEYFSSKMESGFNISIESIAEPHFSILKSMFNSWGITLKEPSPTDPSIHCEIIGVLEKDIDSLRTNLAKRTYPEKRPTIYLTSQTFWPIVRDYTLQPILTLPLSHDDFCANIEAVLGIGKEINSEGELIDQELIDSIDSLNLKVLLVEDNRMNQKVFELMAQKLSVTVDVAPDGIEALQKVYQQGYDIIFMDYHMPNLNGIEATYKIRQMDGIVSQPWIIGFSANVESKTLRDMMNAGMNDTLPKPMKLSHLRHALRNYLKITGRLQVAD